VSQAVVERLQAEFGDRILSTSDAFGDSEALVASKDWVEVARFLRDDEQTQMDHFLDVTAIDYPQRESARFDVTLMVRSSTNNARILLRTHVKEGEKLGTLSDVWLGANWGEREVFDMFGIEFDGHPDMRRILMYEEFQGHPLRKDYPIDKTQPLVPYREVGEIEKLPPFGIEEGQPFARIDWEARLAGGDHQVSPSIGVQLGQRRTLSDSEAARQIQARIDAQLAEEQQDEAAAPAEESAKE
jgi:NADH-quinone oxidoreductase subunit C